jgi:hypothetical protein
MPTVKSDSLIFGGVLWERLHRWYVYDLWNFFEASNEVLLLRQGLATRFSEHPHRLASTSTAPYPTLA